MKGAWLFVRGSDSVWVQRPSETTFDLVVHGPLSTVRNYSFGSEGELDGFLGNVETRLLCAGWMLERFDPGDDRRAHDDRPRIMREGERRRA